MSRAIFLSLVVSFSNLACADACLQIADDKDRLACFDAARSCATIQSNIERLACFDSAYSAEVSSNLQTQLPDPPVDPPEEPDASVENSGVVQTSAQNEPSEPIGDSNIPESFGLRERPATAKGHIEAVILEVRTNALKIDFLVLDNGHIWRENEDSRVRFRVGRKVIIEEGILGSYNLTMEGAPRAVKVKRVK